MLFDLIKSFFAGQVPITELILEFVFVAVIVLFSLSVHEAAHGYAAYKLGDPTARYLGRLTLDPTKHLDPIGTICMLFFGFGWAKPVPVNSRYFKKPKRDMALTAFAGPLSNILVSFVCLLIYSLIFAAFKNVSFSSEFALNIVNYFLIFFAYAHSMNLYLAIFNLIPIPPLDGSRLLFIFLPDKYYFGLMKYEQYIKIAFLVALYLGIISVPLEFVADAISKFMGFVIGLIPGL